MMAKKLNWRQARWSLLLAQFDFIMHHRPGKSMGKRTLCPIGLITDQVWKTMTTWSSLLQISLRSEHWKVLEAAGEERGILKDIQKGTRDGEKEEPVARAARELQGSSACSVKSVEWSLSDGLLYFQGKIYVPDTSDLHCWIITLSHDSRLAGHSRRWKTLELVSRNYWWPQMSRYVGRYISTCDVCLQTKSFRHPLTREFHPLPIPSALWDTIRVDFIVELPQSAGYDSIMVVDSVTKCTHFVSTVTTISAAGATHLFLHHVWKHHGLPQKVISDRGPQFVAEFTQELYWLLRIKLAATMAYHPQGDGQTEWVNQELEQYL